MAGEVGDGGVNGGGSGESCGCGDTGGECQKSDTSSTSIIKSPQTPYSTYHHGPKCIWFQIDQQDDVLLAVESTEMNHFEME